MVVSSSSGICLPAKAIILPYGSLIGTINLPFKSGNEYLEYDGQLVFNTSKPSGQFRKPSSNKRLLEKTSWKTEDYTPFDIALKKTCEWFKAAYPNVRGMK